MRSPAFHCGIAFATFLSTAAAEWIWIEGEAPGRSTVQKHSWYSAVKKDLLSGNEWLSHYGDHPGEATYPVEVVREGNYTFWARLNPVASQPSWRLDQGTWRPVDFKDARGQQNIASDGKVDHRFIAWVKLAELSLTPGAHAISFRWEGGAANSGGLDCFILTTERFAPQGALKPSGESTAAAAGAWFPLLAEDDTFSTASVIDMSRLIPAPAGKFGFLKADGERLRFENAASATKLFGVNANLQHGRHSREQLTQRAKYLRKFGVNCVRQHPLWDEVTTGGVIDPAKLDAYDWWFAELKKHGIYSDWSVFYHWSIGPKSGYPLYEDLPGGELRDTYGVIAAAPKLWELRNEVLVELLTHKNPYTGLRYADDPALAVVEMNNEESIFFWNPLGELSNHAPKKWVRHAQQLRAMFATWTRARYSTDAELKDAWGELRAGDSVNAPELKLMSPWEVDGDGIRGVFAGQNRRAGDVVRFLAELQRNNFEKCEAAIRGTGFRAVTITTAWKAGSGALEPANLWTDAAGSMIDRHDYFGGGDGGHGIAEGGVKWQSHLTRPGMGIFSTNLKAMAGRPFSMTEWTQSPPNRWKHEALPIMAFWGLGLQGWDASWHFMQSGTRLDDGWPRMSAYASDTPHYLGQFPALAFAVHRGHIKEAPVVVARCLALDDIFSGKDPLRRDFSEGKYSLSAHGTPAETFAIGRVTLSFGGGKSEQADLAKFWDEQKKLIRSATGELVWDYGRERLLVQASKTQAIVGKAGPELVQLPGVSATIKTAFISLIFTPLDDAALAESKHILVTALGQDQQTGTRYNADGTRLDSTGTAPLLLEPVQATLRFAGIKPTAVNALDHYGVPTGKKVPIAADGTVTIDGSYRAYYYEVKR